MKKLVVSLLAAGLVLPSAAALAQDKEFHVYSEDFVTEVRSDMADIQVKINEAKAKKAAALEVLNNPGAAVVEAQAKLVEAQKALASAQAGQELALGRLANVEKAGEAAKGVLPQAKRAVADAAKAVEAAQEGVVAAQKAVVAAQDSVAKAKAEAQKAYRAAIAEERALTAQLIERAKTLTDDDRKGLPADVKEAVAAAEKDADSAKKDEAVKKAVDKAKADKSAKSGKKALPKTSAAK